MTKNFHYEYPHPAVTVDLVIFTIIQGKLKVLLIERGKLAVQDALPVAGEQSVGEVSGIYPQNRLAPA